MALDSADKRASALSRRRFVAPVPDGAISTADRVHLARSYRGVLPAESAIDSRDKRASIIGLRQPWRQVAPNPAVDIINAYDRKQLAGLYRDEESGIRTLAQASAFVPGAVLTTEIRLEASAAAVASSTSTLGDILGPAAELEASASAVATATGALTTAIRLRATAVSTALAFAGFNRLPIAVGTPAPSFVQGIPSTYSVASFFTDLDGDPFIIVLSPGPTWPLTGITYDQPNKRFVYDGTNYGLPVGSTITLPYTKLIADDGISRMALARVHTSATGTLTNGIALFGAAVGNASGQGLLSAPTDLFVLAVGGASAVAELTIASGLSALAEGVAGTTATLGDVIELASFAAGEAGAIAEMGGGAGAILSAAEALASADAVLTTEIRLVGAAFGEATALPRLGPNPIFSSLAPGEARAVANLRTAGQKGKWLPEDSRDDIWEKEPAL